VTGAPVNIDVALDSATIAASHVVGAGSSEGQALTKVVNIGEDAVGTLIPGQVLTESNDLQPVASSSKRKAVARINRPRDFGKSMRKVEEILLTPRRLCDDGG
jgi:hypothetical protein